VSLTIALVYESFDSYPRKAGEPADQAAEYEPESTVVAIEAAFIQLGHEVVRVGTPHDLLAAIAREETGTFDAALSIAEGFGSRNREAWALNLLEMAGIPTLGSDALTLSLCLDKAWTNRNVDSAGIRVASQCTIADRASAETAELPAPFPLFVKPRWEGTSKGITETSRVTHREELAREVGRIVGDYDQPALVEAFLEGAEYTVTIAGHEPPRALPVLQRALDEQTRIGLHAIEGVHEELKDPAAPTREHCLPGKLDPELEAELQRLALEVFGLFECRDFARVDFRLDAEGRPVFLEINPLPTFAVDGSFGILAELEGRSASDLLSEVFGQALDRLGVSSAGLNKESS
jgi:D-alanine-D-alanine ligase